MLYDRDMMLVACRLLLDRYEQFQFKDEESIRQLRAFQGCLSSASWDKIRMREPGEWFKTKEDGDADVIDLIEMSAAEASIVSNIFHHHPDFLKVWRDL